MSGFFTRLSNHKHFKNGVPFFLFIFGGGFALKELRTVRYDPELNPKIRNLIKPEEAFKDKSDKVKFNQTKESLDNDLETLNSSVDVNNWENVRGPRPWEEGSIKERPVYRVNKPPPTVKELTGGI